MANFLPTTFTSGCSSNQGRLGFILLLNMYCARPSASQAGTFSLKLRSNHPHSHTQYYTSSRFKENGGNQASSKPTENSSSLPTRLQEFNQCHQAGWWRARRPGRGQGEAPQPPCTCQHVCAQRVTWHDCRGWWLGTWMGLLGFMSLHHLLQPWTWHKSLSHWASVSSSEINNGVNNSTCPRALNIKYVII